MPPCFDSVFHYSTDSSYSRTSSLRLRFTILYSATALNKRISAVSILLVSSLASVQHLDTRKTYEHPHPTLVSAVKTYGPWRCKGQMNAYKKYVEVHLKLDSGSSDLAKGRRDKLRCYTEMLGYRSGYTSDIPISTDNQISYTLLDTLDMRKRRGNVANS